MENNVIRLEFEAQQVRAVDGPDGEPWFVGVDVCNALGITKARNSLALLEEDEKGAHTMGTLGGSQIMTIVSEPGVYRLVFRSRKPEAERFKRWLAHEVLPALRRHGRYDMTGADEPAWDPAGVEAARISLEIVKEARLIFGRSTAAALWHALPLPPVPEAPDPDRDALLAYLATDLVAAPGDGAPLHALAAGLTARSGRPWDSARIGKALRAAGYRTGPRRVGPDAATHRCLLDFAFRSVLDQAA